MYKSIELNSSIQFALLGHPQNSVWGVCGHRLPLRNDRFLTDSVEKVDKRQKCRSLPRQQDRKLLSLQ
ncbi:MAG TPA: hypothetical protein VEB01_08320 [Methylocaldum sp.]|nr:hypothetical protein [Methylocaldum sp.]